MLSHLGKGKTQKLNFTYQYAPFFQPSQVSSVKRLSVFDCMCSFHPQGIQYSRTRSSSDLTFWQRPLAASGISLRLAACLLLKTTGITLPSLFPDLVNCHLVSLLARRHILNFEIVANYGSAAKSRTTLGFRVCYSLCRYQVIGILPITLST